jgi:2-polyprenyl-6-methoxyphenol hydroxylase-like FAD-dependent oxidoreductase
MGLLPTKEQHGIRPTNIITRPNHQVWKLQNASQVKAWFQAAFPRMDFDSLVDDTEWERFAAASGTKFPYCQHSKGVAVSSPDGQAGVALVGDSAHAFPPDIGQGINAGLMDVIALDRALRGDDIVKGNATGRFPASLGQALDRYQRNRVPEHRALIRLARFGAPYQYNQPWRRDRLGKRCGRPMWSFG